MYCPITNSNFDDINSPIDDNTWCQSDCDICSNFVKVQFSCFTDDVCDIFDEI